MRLVYHGSSDTVSLRIDGDEYFVLDDGTFEALIDLGKLSRSEYDKQRRDTSD